MAIIRYAQFASDEYVKNQLLLVSGVMSVNFQNNGVEVDYVTGVSAVTLSSGAVIVSGALYGRIY